MDPAVLRQDLESANTLLGTAYSYQRSMEVILRDWSPNTKDLHTPAFFLLAGFAFEFALKAIVSAETQDESARSDLRHDLSAALDRAHKAGFRASDEEELDWAIQRLTPIHLNHLMRYVPDVPEIDMPAPSRTLDSLARLIDDARARYLAD